MNRDLEWQRRYEEEDTPWDKGLPAPPLVNYLREHPMTGRVLVPGCGRGHEVRAIAAQENASVVGLDLSPAAVAQARDITAQPGVKKRASFLEGDFLALPDDLVGSFDWLVEHTCFCALEPRQRQAYVHSAALALRKDGRLFGIFYLTPDVESGPPFAISKGELSVLFESHFRLEDEWVPKESFPGRESRERVRLLRKR